MNILLVEDNPLKKKIIELGLVKYNPDVNIRHFNNLSEAEEFMDEYEDVIDLLVLDWCFPEKRGERAHDGEGQKALDYILDNHYNIKTIICSGNDLSDTTLVEDYHFLIGIIHFGEGNPAPIIYGLYSNYWANICDIYSNRKDKPHIKKLVNYDVK